jgi:carboxymethylenebutenolidase
MDDGHSEKEMNSVWDQHVGAEFAAKDPDQAVNTMTPDTFVNLVPLMTGGVSREQVRDFYAKHFLPQIPPDMEMTSVTRTVGQGRVVDELVGRFTHSVQMDWLLPGVPPTGKRVELIFVVIVQFKDGKIAFERIYWDQASVLLQLGLIDASLPVRGGEITQQVLNPNARPMNEIIQRGTKA